MLKYGVLFLLLVAFGAADDESKSESAEAKEILSDLRVLLSAIRNECAKDTDAVDNLMSASAHVKTNVQPDLQKKFKDVLTNTSREGNDDVVTPMCEGLDQIKNVYVNLTGYLIPCFEKEDMKTLQSTYDMFDGLINYSCVTNRSDVIDFMVNGGVECFKQNITELEACGDSAFGSVLDESSEKSNEKSDEDTDFVITKEYCDMFKKFKSCIHNTLKDCSYSAASLVVEGFVESVLKEMPCYEAEKELDNNI